MNMFLTFTLGHACSKCSDVSLIVAGENDTSTAGNVKLAPRLPDNGWVLHVHCSFSLRFSLKFKKFKFKNLLCRNSK